MNVNLDTIEIDPDSDDSETGFWIDGNRITDRWSGNVAVYTLPKGCRRISLMRLGQGRSQLTLGGFKANTVTVTGPTKVIERLREAVL